MEITYSFGNLYVDGHSFNTNNLSEALAKVFNIAYSDMGCDATPYNVTFHECNFKDTYMQLVDDIVIRDDTNLTYFFKEAISLYKGEYTLNLNIKFEYCKFYNCTFPNTSYSIAYVVSGGERLARAIILNEYVKLPYANIDEYPTWYYNDGNTLYKILRNNSSSIAKYYLAKVTIPGDATAIRTINGDIRCDKVVVNDIMQILEIDNNKYSDDEKYNFEIITNIDHVEHSPLVGPQNLFITYTKGSEVIASGLDVNSFRAFGDGIYGVCTKHEALNILNRVLSKDQLILNTTDSKGKYRNVVDKLYNNIVEKPF